MSKTRVIVSNLENNERENDSNLRVKRPVFYNKPRKRQALLQIKRLILEEGKSHSEIQLDLKLPAATYFRYLDALLKTDEEALRGNNYTYKRLLNETLILQQRFLRRAKRLEKIADDTSVDADIRIEAEMNAAKLERAVHDMSYHAPSYLRAQGLKLPEPKRHHPTLSMTRIDRAEGAEEKDPSEKERLKIAGEIRQENILRKQNQEQK